MNIQLDQLPEYTTHQMSLCLIAKNEATTLPKLFASLGGFKGEILLVDTGSTDQTIEVAKHHGAKVIDVGNRFRQAISSRDLDLIAKQFAGKIHVEGRNLNHQTFFNFGEARNYAISQCQHDIIIMPDCDEHFVHVNWNLLQYWFDQKIGEGLASEVIYESHETDEYVLNKLYIFDRRKYNYQHIIHEQAMLIDPHGRHHSVLPRKLLLLKQLQEKKPRNYIIPLLHSYVNHPGETRYQYFLAREFNYNYLQRDHPEDNYHDSIKLLRGLLIEMEDPTYSGDRDNMFDVYYTLIDNYVQLQRYDEALYSAFHALRFAGARPEFFIHLAEIYLQLKNYDEATIYCQLAITYLKEFSTKNFGTKMTNYYKERPYLMLYTCYYVRGQFAKAHAIYQELTAFKPLGHDPQVMNLYLAHPSQSQYLNPLIQYLKSAKNLTGQVTKYIDYHTPTIVIGAHLWTNPMVCYPNTIILNTMIPETEHGSHYHILTNQHIVWDINPASASSSPSHQYIKLEN